MIALIASAVLAPCRLNSQDTAAASDAGPRFQIFRYASRSSPGMYSGYDTGPLLVVFGILHNLRGQYREVMAALGRPLDLGRGGSMVVVGAGAYTNTGWYGQLYLVPTLHPGQLELSGTMQVAEPLSRRGSRGFFVSPSNALVELGGGFAAGAGYYGSMESGAPPYHGAGPALRRAVPRGSVTLECTGAVTGGQGEVRLTLRSSFQAARIRRISVARRPCQGTRVPRPWSGTHPPAWWSAG